MHAHSEEPFDQWLCILILLSLSRLQSTLVAGCVSLLSADTWLCNLAQSRQHICICICVSILVWGHIQVGCAVRVQDFQFLTFSVLH